MWNKVLSLALAVMLLMPSLALASGAAADMTVTEKITELEKIFYDNEQSGSLLERVERLERDMYGSKGRDALIPRVDKLYSYVKEGTSSEPAYLVKLTAVEWTFNHSITSFSIKTRLENLEQSLNGHSLSGTFDKRLNQLIQMAYADGTVQALTTVVPKDALIRIKLVSSLDTRNSREGDVVRFQAAEDVFADGLLVIPKGAKGIGKVTKVEPARNFGRDAHLEIAFDTVESIDGTPVATLLGERAKEQSKSLVKAAGATVAGVAILGPIGLVGGAFVNGDEVSIPAGSEMYIQVKEDASVYGLKTK